MLHFSSMPQRQILTIDMTNLMVSFKWYRKETSLNPSERTYALISCAGMCCHTRVILYRTVFTLLQETMLYLCNPLKAGCCHVLVNLYHPRFVPVHRSTALRYLLRIWRKKLTSCYGAISNLTYLLNG